MEHTVCGTILDVIPDSILHERFSCPICLHNRYSKEYTRSTKDYKEQVEKETSGEYTPITEYVDVYTHIVMRHNICGNTWEITPQVFQHGRRCPRCSGISNGEKSISKILDNLGIVYEYQKGFTDLKDTKQLTYDFFIPSKNLLIEYQGIQHFKPRKLFGGEEAFKKQVYHDNMKNIYAENSGYNLLYIPYTVNKYNDILNIIINAIS